MKKIEYYCDCCGEKVNNEKDLKNVEIYDRFKWAQGDDYTYSTKEVCNKCNDILDDVLFKKFYEIKNK